jgi:hypothetical protein
VTVGTLGTETDGTPGSVSAIAVAVHPNITAMETSTGRHRIARSSKNLPRAPVKHRLPA